MSKDEVDAYIDALDEPKRSTLEEVRRRILAVVPDAEQGLSYGAPVFTVRGKRVAGFAAFAKHLTYAPHSATVSAPRRGSERIHAGTAGSHSPALSAASSGASHAQGSGVAARES